MEYEQHYLWDELPDICEDEVVVTFQNEKFNNLAGMKHTEQKNEQERSAMAEGTQGQMNAEFIEACLSLEEILKCPICLEYLGAPVAQCVRGHGVCGTCKTGLRVCPLCQERFMNFTASVLSQVVKALPRCCKYRLEGCSEFVKAGDSHKDFCGFRPTKCLLCSQSVAVNSLLSHYQTAHNKPHQQDVSSGVMALKLTETKATYDLFSCYNQLFWRKINVDVENNFFSIAFVRIPSEDIDKIYCAKIKLKKGNFKYSARTVIPFVLKEFNIHSFPANIMIPLEIMAHMMESFSNSTDDVLAFDLNITEIN